MIVRFPAKIFLVLAKNGEMKMAEKWNAKIGRLNYGNEGLEYGSKK